MSAEPMARQAAGGDARARRDAVLAVSVVACGGAAFMSLDAFERVAPALLRFEAIQLDELLLTSFLAVAAASWFALRRVRDSTRQLRALQAAERERARDLQRLQELSAQLVSTEERERARLAAALHDGVSQTLYACRIELDALHPMLDDPRLRRRVHDARTLVCEAMDQARSLTTDLSPPILHDLGLLPALEWLLPRLQARHGLELRLVRSSAWACVPRGSEAAVFHSVSELLVNACKHAGARTAIVSAEAPSEHEVRILVRDDGNGFDRERTGHDGFGLFGIERRMAHLHGRLDIDSSPSMGTTAILTLPTVNAAGAVAGLAAN